MAEVPALNVKINIDASGIGAGVKKATEALKQFTQNTDKDIVKLRNGFNDFGRQVSRSMKIATAAVGAFAIKMGTDAVQAAMADQKSQVMLANALRNSTGATTAAIAGVEDYITALQKTYFVADDELRPALARLASATGSVAGGQRLMSTALDVSAFATVDLATASDAVIKATKGQFKALANLVPGISLATIKSKDLGRVFEEVGKITAGSATERTKTFEYRLNGLKIAFGEILETLGYRLMPVLEKFAQKLSTDILPKIEAWIALNKDKLAASLTTATEFALKFLTALMSIGAWIARNATLVKNMAIFFAAMFVTTKVYQMITAINLLTAAIVRMNVAAGAGAIGAITKTAAKGGIFATGAAAIAAGNVGYNLGGKIAEAIPGTKANRLKTAEKVFGNPSFNPKSPSPSDIASGAIKATANTAPTKPFDLEAYLKTITDELKKGNEQKEKDVKFVTVYASNTNDIAKKLSKVAKNGQPIGGGK